MLLDNYLKSKNIIYSRDYEGYSQQCELQVMLLKHLVSKPTIKRVLEIGFNAGHSSEIFLSTNPNVDVTSFDIGRVNAVSVAKEYMDLTYPGRHTLILGDSTQTIKEYKNANPEATFDLIFIDGGHTYGVAKSDIVRCSGLAHENTIVIVDDIAFRPGFERGWTTGPSKCWQEGVQHGEIQELGTILSIPGKGMAYGKYLKSWHMERFRPMPKYLS